MHRYVSLAASLIFVGTLLVPLTASAITPVGGFVTFLRPCNTGYLITVINPAGIGSGQFMWTPGTLDYPWGPPTVGRWVLGLTDVPLPCFIGHTFWGWGQRITFDGTSLTI